MIAKELMAQEIKHRLDSKTPTSIVRYGDGEGMLLEGFRNIPNLKALMKRQLGFIPGIEDIEAMQNNLRQAYLDADIIGTPTSHHIDKGGAWATCWDYIQGYLPNKETTSIDFHNYMLDHDQFRYLFAGVDTICYISCRNIDRGLQRTYNIKNVHHFLIAPEAKFTSGYKGAKHYPDLFNAAYRWMRAVPIEGNLCLFGAGVVGKVYGSWFKEKGGIAVDIGNVFDAWAGRVTRGPDRGMDVIDNKFKL